jgi:Phage integrase family
MAKPRAARLETATARLRLPVRRRPYPGPSVTRGVHLYYRRNRTAGTWVVKAANGHGQYWTKAFACADDFEKSDGRAILTYHQATEAAKRVARGDANAPDTKPVTVEDALTAYDKDLQSRGADAANARRVRRHLTPALAGKPVGLLRLTDLRDWRDGLIAKGLRPANINRTAAGLRAALELAATLDHRITNRETFRLLRRLPGAGKARRIVLSDADVLKIVEAAYQECHALGVLVQALAETGARVSQIARVRHIDLQADRADPRVLIPTSFKGHRQKERQSTAVPITPDLGGKLKAMRGNRDDDEILLRKADGAAWNTAHKSDYFGPFADAVKRAGLDPKTTSYALRHSSICRALLAGIPVSIVSRLHDTSAREIEAHYGRYILDVSEQLARRSLLTPPSIGANVVAVRK